MRRRARLLVIGCSASLLAAWAGCLFNPQPEPPVDGQIVLPGGGSGGGPLGEDAGLGGSAGRPIPDGGMGGAGGQPSWGGAGGAAGVGGLGGQPAGGSGGGS